jgi:hypothetical protein
MTIFEKTIHLRVRIRVCVDIRTIVVLTGDSANSILLSTFTFEAYYSVMMLLRPGKKVSNLSSGDVNLGPVPSRCGLLEECPYRAIWTACLSCDWP